MDVNGARVLQRRLGSARAAEPRPPVGDLPDDLPPVYRWLGVRAGERRPPAAPADDALARRASWLRRFGLSTR
jgi:hypothetical protein